MRLSHPLFRTPLAVELPLLDAPMPEGYRDWLDGVALPPTLAMWRVQEGRLSDDVDFGEVVDPHEFEDSPDCEWICGGVNGKGPAALAIGRQANRLFWGFSGDPSQMTPSARQVFLNAIAWIDGYDGQTPLEAEREVTWLEGREATLIDIGLFLHQSETAPQSASAAIHRDRIPRELLESCRDAPQRMLAEYRSRIEFVTARVQEREVTLSFDPVLERHGVSNRRPEFFDPLLALLEGTAADPVDATALHERYLDPAVPRDAAGLRAWRELHRDRLYFSDRFGDRWRIAPAGLKPRS
jgi:hypothetical protein